VVHGIDEDDDESIVTISGKQARGLERFLKHSRKAAA
jgi:hypothetical protein